MSAIVLLCAVRVMASWLAHLVFQESEDVYIVLQLTLRSLTLYIYGAPILDVSRSHTMTQHSR